jgi:hypothetical protein
VRRGERLDLELLVLQAPPEPAQRSVVLLGVFLKGLGAPANVPSLRSVALSPKKSTPSAR